MSDSKRCAACKYLRRRCPKDCIFAPYFPPTNLERFVCVHKIFGASNVAKMLQQIPEGRRREAAESMVWEARSRVRDPVHGTVGMITQLKQQIMEVEYELAKTQALNSLFNAQHHHQLTRTQVQVQARTGTEPEPEPQPQPQHYDLRVFDQFWQLLPQQSQTTSHCLEDFQIENLISHNNS